MMFFYSQLLTGDSVDNIPGLKGYGPAKAYEVLKDCKTEKDLFEAVQWEYEACVGKDWQEYLLEQGQLLWMIRERDEDGELVHWTIPTFEDEENGE
jgi:5'-3' exonuclease